jgi:hypothetical protein
VCGWRRSPGAETAPGVERLTDRSQTGLRTIRA